ncbi:MAG: outer membrane beta-barrel protein [Steroidobacteraceae bacterium]
MNLKIRSGALLVCLGLGCVTPAQSMEPGWYLVGFGGEASASGLSQGQTDANVLAIFDSIGLDAVINSSTIDDSDTGYGVAGGYQHNANFAVEFAYVNLGSVEYNAFTTVTDGVEVADAELGLKSSAAGPVISLLGILPVGDRFSLFGRAGLSFMSAKGTARIAIDGTSERARQTSQKSDPVFGAGAEFSLGKHAAIRLAWDRYLDVGTEDVTGDVDTDLITLGLRVGIGWLR